MEPHSPAPPSTLSAEPTEYWEPSHKRPCCARRGTQLMLVGLLSTAMWAAVLTLLLLWRKDIPSPQNSPITETFYSHPNAWGAQHPLWNLISPTSVPSQCPPPRCPASLVLLVPQPQLPGVRRQPSLPAPLSTDLRLGNGEESETAGSCRHTEWYEGVKVG